VYSFGCNTFGQLGNEVVSNECSPQKINLEKIDKIFTSCLSDNSYFINGKFSIFIFILSIFRKK
jgi:hypothetical protein